MNSSTDAIRDNFISRSSEIIQRVDPREMRLLQGLEQASVSSVRRIYRHIKMTASVVSYPKDCERNSARPIYAPEDESVFLDTLGQVLMTHVRDMGGIDTLRSMKTGDYMMIPLRLRIGDEWFCSMSFIACIVHPVTGVNLASADNVQAAFYGAQLLAKNTYQGICFDISGDCAKTPTIGVLIDRNPRTLVKALRHVMDYLEMDRKSAAVHLRQISAHPEQIPRVDLERAMTLYRALPGSKEIN